jgi:hypothetical protein
MAAAAIGAGGGARRFELRRKEGFRLSAAIGFGAAEFWDDKGRTERWFDSIAAVITRQQRLERD